MTVEETLMTQPFIVISVTVSFFSSLCPLSSVLLSQLRAGVPKETVLTSSVWFSRGAKSPWLPKLTDLWRSNTFKRISLFESLRDINQRLVNSTLSNELLATNYGIDTSIYWKLNPFERDLSIYLNRNTSPPHVQTISKCQLPTLTYRDNVKYFNIMSASGEFYVLKASICQELEIWIDFKYLVSLLIVEFRIPSIQHTCCLDVILWNWL